MIDLKKNTFDFQPNVIFYTLLTKTITFMKQRLKLIAKFIAICALVVLISCEKELYEEGIKQNNNLKIEQKSFQELLLNKKFSSAYEKVEKSKVIKREALQGRTSLEDEYNFTIVEQSPVKILTNDSDGSVTYVMLIERPITENLKFENLILYDKNGILDGRIIKYTLSKEPEKDENHGGEILDIINTEMTTLEIDGRYGIPCVMTYTIMCGTLGTTPYNNYTGVHIANWECYSLSNDLFMVTSLECAGGGANDGVGSTGVGSTSGNSNTGPNGGSGVGTTPSIPTSPISPFGSNEAIQKTPCESLNKILQTPTSLPAGAISIKDALNQLSNNADDGLNHEEGFNFVFNPTNGQMYAVSADPLDDNMIKYSRNALVFGGGHFHQAGLEPQFSHDDLFVLSSFINQFNTNSTINNAQAPLPMHILVTTDGNVYAIMADDMNAFSTLINSIYNNRRKRNKFRAKLADEYADKYVPATNSYPTNPDVYQIILLSFIKNINDFDGNGDLGIKLYKANKTNDVLTGSWEELSLKQTNELNFYNFTIEKTNCN